jgi:hypothetical protein
MKSLSSFIENSENLNGSLLLQIGATLGQLHQHYDHLINQNDARRFGDFNYNRKASRLAKTYRRDIVYEIKERGSHWLLKYKDFRAEPFETHFDGVDFYLLDDPSETEEMLIAA